MRLNRLYTESIVHFSQPIQEWLIQEAPHTHFEVSTLPDQFKFLGGSFVDLGFENLGLEPEEFRRLVMAFNQEGIRIPKSQYKMRHVTNPDITIVEPAEGLEPALPPHWLAAVYVLDGNEFSWVGERVRPDQVGNIDFSRYQRVAWGWALAGEFAKS